MTAVAFDTLRFVRTLRDKAKMPQEQAEGLADAVAEAIQGDLATKADIEALRSATKTDIDGLRSATKADIEALRSATKTDIEALRSDTKTDIAAVRADVEALRLASKADIEALRLSLSKDIEVARADTIRWVTGLIGFQTVALIGAVVAVAKALH